MSLSNKSGGEIIMVNFCARTAAKKKENHEKFHLNCNADFGKSSTNIIFILTFSLFHQAEAMMREFVAKRLEEEQVLKQMVEETIAGHQNAKEARVRIQETKRKIGRCQQHKCRHKRN